MRPLAFSQRVRMIWPVQWKPHSLTLSLSAATLVTVSSYSTVTLFEAMLAVARWTPGIRLADRISVLIYGRILASGTPAGMRADPRVVAAYLGDEME